jgi:hypothetical protein
LLLRAVELIQAAMAEKKITLNPITTGASSGIFALEPTASVSAECVASEVRTFLREHPQLRHATFVVDVVEASGDFRIDREKLIALNRWQQMKAPTVVIAGRDSSGPCWIDKVRPAEIDAPWEKFKGKKISLSVQARREYGIKQKQQFYQDTLGRPISTSFAWDFEHIGAAGSERGNLAGKMAVIYADGNRFGDLQNRLCTDRKLQEDYDKQLKNHRKEFLKAFLEQKVLPDPEQAFVGFKGGNSWYRMETLLWGGDEFMLLVPAWRGWFTLQFFFDRAKTWNLLGETVTHAAGLVFCSHKAPIHRVADLARKLCDAAKKDKSRNLFAYQILESFDIVGDFETYRKSMAPHGYGIESLNLEGPEMGEIDRLMSDLKAAEFPRRKLFDLARGRLSKADEKDFLSGLPAKARDAAEGLRILLNDSARWYHIAELWDYAGKGGATPWL